MGHRRIDVISNATLREDVHWTVLPCGLQVYFLPKPGFRKRYACFSAHYGSMDREFLVPGEGHPARVPDGVAHFLEHTLFENEEGNALRVLSERGASANAYTNFSQTTYLFSSAERFEENLLLLLDFVRRPYFTDDNVEKEKGIIAQEIRMYDDHPEWVVYTSLLKNLFHEHPIRIDIAGTVESVSAIDKETLYRCYRTFYHPANMILFIVGDLDRDRIFDFVDGALPGDPPGSDAGVSRIRPREGPSIRQRESRRRMVVSTPLVLVGFKESSPEGRSLLWRELVTGLALDLLVGRGSDGFEHLYEKELVDDSFSAGYSGYPDVGFSAIGGETRDPDALRGEILRMLGEAGRKGISQEDFDRGKRSFIGRFIRHFNSLEYIANHFTSYRFHDENLFNAIDVLEGVTRGHIEERIRTHLSPENSAASVVEGEGAPS